jgi:peptide/nickel transport system substrate-binding protein
LQITNIGPTHDTKGFPEKIKVVKSIRDGGENLTVRVVLVGCTIVIAMIASAIFPFFGGGSTSAPVPAVSQAAGEKVLVIAMDSDIQIMDPSKTAVLYGPPEMIYETLITRDKTGAYAPGLAESWALENMSGTGYLYTATYNLNLRHGIEFHDGTPFNSDAVKRVLDYYARNDSWIQYQFWSIYGCQNKTGWPDCGIWCVDEYHITLNLTRTDVALTFNLANLYSSMISPEAVESDGATSYGTPGHNVVGTGAYILQEWVPGDHVTLVKNPTYTWGPAWCMNKGPAKIDKIIYRIIYDQPTRYAAFESGAIDILQQVQPNKVLSYQTNPALSIITGPGQGTYHLEFNCQKAPWTNASLRKAFAYAINRSEILERVWHGYGEEGVNYLPPIEPESTNVPAQYNFTYDVARSQELFEEAGYSDVDADGWLEDSMGDDLTLQIWTANRGEEVVMSEMLQAQFQDMGVHVVLTQFTPTELRIRAELGLQDSILFWYSWPRAEILDWHFGTWCVGGSNTAWYTDPVFDQYVENWTHAETEAEFSENATAAHIRLLTQGPWAPILYWHQIDAVHNNVTGWYVQPFGMEHVFDILDVAVPPVAVAVVTPNPAMAGEEVTLDGSGSSDDAGLVNWTWTFVDSGVPVELWGEIVVYEFKDDFQSVEVTLTVRNSHGTVDADTVVVEILGMIPEYSTLLTPTVGTILMTLPIVLRARRRRAENNKRDCGERGVLPPV